MFQKPSRLFFLLFSLIIIVAGCNNKNNSSTQAKENNALSETAIKYAEGFRIEHFDNYTKVSILNPWQKKETYATYYLFDSDTIDLPDDGFKLKVPLKSVVVNTFSYFEFLQQLSELETVSGVTDGFRVYNPFVLERLKNGEIADLGDPFNPNVEKTMVLRPDAIIKSAYAQQDNYGTRLTDAGFPIIYTLEWMEKSPLARAEWIKLIAAFYGKEATADSVFTEIESRYNAQKKLAEKVSEKKTVLAGDNFQGTWYVPGGESFNANLFKDAGLDYTYKNNKESGSIGLDIETVLTQFGEADVWLGCEADTYAQLAEKDAKYLLLKSVKDRKVFNNHARMTPTGGNDYFESAIAHPDLLLADIIKAVYPELLPEASFTYIKSLTELHEK